MRPGLHNLAQSAAVDKQVPGWDNANGIWVPRNTVHSVVQGANVTVDNTDPFNPVVAATGGGGSLTIQDENLNVATGVTQIDFQGAGVTAAAGSGEVVVTIAGGGGGGGAITTYLGTNSVGASLENITIGRMYAKKITASSAGVLESVQAYFTQGATASFTMKGIVWEDVAGTPGRLLSVSHSTDIVIATAGWRAFPVDVELVAGASYWIGFVVSAMPIGSGSLQISYGSGSGSDRYQASGTVSQVGDWNGAFGPTTTTNNYSIRGMCSVSTSALTGISVYPDGSLDSPPMTANVQDDEFDGTSSVSWINTPTAPNTWDITTRRGFAYLKASGSGSNLVGKYQAIPGAFPFTVITKVESTTARQNFHRGGGFVFYPAAPTSASACVYLGPVYNTNGVEVVRVTYSNATTFASQSTFIGQRDGLPAREVYLKAVFTSATAASLYYSVDGYAWILAETYTFGFSVAFMGLAASEETANTGVEATFPFFRVNFTPGTPKTIPASNIAGKDRRWVVGSSETSIDEFNDSSLDAAWTRVDGTGAASANVVYTEDADVLSVKQEGGDTAGVVHGLVRPLTGAGGALAIGDGFVTQPTPASLLANLSVYGLVLADGNTFGAGNQVMGFAYVFGTAATAFNHDCRAFTGWNTNPSTVAAIAAPFPFFVYQRLALIAANTWRHDWSPDGVSWIKGTATLSKTMTATHVGFISSSWGTSTKTVVAYEFLRRVAGVT